MESSRRPFDSRSREPGLKKPRLMMEDPNNPNSRPFPQRQLVSGITTLSSTRFRANDRDSEGGYQPQPAPAPAQHHQELVNQYKTALAELTFNSKPIITNLTIIAGENQSAAKAIAATVCANILEVPSEQKLPSLYLLDSIVKNIGRDYIKYFAARLPEVFCKAYRQVEPPVHQSMRHLFGTWKGVFPPQTLQIIEKELSFTPLVNGSASASATLRSDSQSQRPPHSIHVNPKYLERQRLQQTSRIKGVDDITGALTNSHEDPERPDRALGVSRPWADPRVSIHRDAFNESALEKSVSASYGGNEYGSDLSRNLGSDTGRASDRATDLGLDKSWYKAGGVAGTLSGQRNGFSAKHSFSNTEAPKYHQPTQNINSIRSSVVSSSWKNSEEEEYTWDEMNSRLTGHGAPNPWTADDENLEVEDHVQIRNSFGANVDREMATESLGTEKKHFPAFRRHSSLPWQLQEQQSLDEMNQKSSHSEGYMSTIGGLPANTNSSATRIGNRPFLSNTATGLAGIVGQQQFHSAGAESPSASGQSPLRQQSSSPPLSVDHPQLRNLAEQDHPQSLKTSQFLEGLQSQYIKDSSPAIPPNVQAGNLRRSQQKDSKGPFSSMTSFQPRHQQLLGLSHTEVTLKTEKPPMSKVSLARETSEKSTSSSLEAATVKSGIFPNLSTTISLPTRSRLNTGNLPSQLGVRPSQSSGPSSVPAIAAPSSLPSNDNSSALAKKPERKAGQLPRASTLPPASSDVSSASAQTSSATNNALNPIADLLSSLVAKGLISTESESRTKTPSEILARLEDQRESTTTSSSLPVASASGSAAVPLPSAVDDVVDTAKSPISLSESTSTEIRNLIGFEFKPDVIRELHPSVIKALFDDLPHHCSVCGLGLKFQEQLNRHLEWHDTRERERNDWTSRQWFLKSSEWTIGKTEYLCEFTESVDTYGKEIERSQEGAMVQADENQCLCVLCGEVFEDFYCQESGEWMFKGAVYRTHLDSNSETGIGDASTATGPIIHARCLSENTISSVVKMEQD